ncbi:unnamed protein product [Cunninghamella blakesleeana]
MSNYRSCESSTLARDIINGRYHDHTLAIFRCVFPDYENLPNFMKPDDEDLRKVLLESDPNAFSASTVIAEYARINDNEPSVVNELTIEIADISAQLGVMNPARIATEHMIDYLFDNTDDYMTLPKVLVKEFKVNVTDCQDTTIHYKVYETEPIYNSVGNYYYPAPLPSSEKERDELLASKFKRMEFTDAEKKSFKIKDILIIETLKSYTVYTDEMENVKNDTDLIKVINTMLKDRVSGDVITWSYLNNHRQFILELATSVLEKLNKENIGLYALNYNLGGYNLKKRYIPLTKVLDKMILELMLVRKYLDYEDKLATIPEVIETFAVHSNKIGYNDFSTKLSLKDFYDLGYTIRKSGDLKLKIGYLNMDLPVINNKWLAYNNILKHTDCKDEWFALITTLKSMLENEASRDIYKEHIGGDTNVLFRIKVPNNNHLKAYIASKSWHRYQINNALYTSYRKLRVSPVAALAGMIAFVLSIYNLIKATNDLTKSH